MRLKILIAYCLIAIITFGHAFKTGQVLLPKEADLDAVLYFSLMDAAAWPLYWSVQLWK